MNKAPKIKTSEKIDLLIKKLGWTSVEVKDAGDRMKFTATKTRYKLYFINAEGAKRMLPFSGGWEKESAQFFAIQNAYCKKYGGKPCKKREIVSAFMRTIEGNCHICGGYGLAPNFDYQTELEAGSSADASQPGLIDKP